MLAQGGLDAKLLREYAINGVPHALRPTMWRFLLGVAEPGELATPSERAAAFAALDRTTCDQQSLIDGEVERAPHLNLSGARQPRPWRTRAKTALCT